MTYYIKSESCHGLKAYTGHFSCINHAPDDSSSD